MLDQKTIGSIIDAADLACHVMALLEERNNWMSVAHYLADEVAKYTGRCEPEEFRDAIAAALTERGEEGECEST